ncbi:MAG: NYN domain-containing protein [Thiobacillus sp.]|nr:NYN domain-containing protein [Thiobacillus sp.]
MTHEHRIALLIDADNSPADMIDEVLDELAKEGVINIRRAYGDWKSPHLNAWAALLHDFAIQPMQQFAYTRGKNATDAAMIIDAMDLLYTKQLDGFGIMSSDSDFTPLVMRLRANGLKVFGFGEQKTPKPFVNACSKFLYLENLRRPEETAAPVTTQPAPAAAAGNGESKPPTRADAKTLRGDTRLINLLRKAVEAAADEEGWAGLGAVGQHISKQASFDSRNYGYAKLSGLFQAIGLFELRTHGKGLQVRDPHARP